MRFLERLCNVVIWVTVRFAENHFAVMHFALVHFAVGAFRRQFILPLIAINLKAIRDILVK